MQEFKFLYTFTYDVFESALSKLESKYLFGKEDNDKFLWSDRKINPSCSGFIKQRLDLIADSKKYDHLIEKIKDLAIEVERFKVEYLVFDGDPTTYKDRLSKLKDIGYSIEGTPNYQKPTVTYALCFYQGIWCFGLLKKDVFDWYKHSKKPRSYSNSIGQHVAKALLNIGTKGDTTKSIIDACCGVGTIMLEACFAGYQIEGCYIIWKIARNARANLAHFNYEAPVFRSDINDIEKEYDVAIIDLPYNLLSTTTEDSTGKIIQGTSRLASTILIVSIADIRETIEDSGLKIVDTCSVGKRGKTKFIRRVWVCEVV